MTEIEIQRINAMRSKGYGYKSIAKALKLPENTVKSYCRRHKGGSQVPVQDLSNEKLHFCKCCNLPVEQVKGRKMKLFCSDACRREWWNKHQELINRKAYYEGVCNHCGNSFVAYGNSNRKFCSHNCYIKHRFGGEANG